MSDLRLRGSFLGALDAAGQTYGERTLVIVDALNEGEAKRMWEEHLPEMLQTLTGFPHVSIVFSCRQTYERYLIPLWLVEEQRLYKLVHMGFRGQES